VTENDRVPKAYRYRLHRLKNAYRKAFRSEPPLERPVTDEAALRAIAFLEEALQRLGVLIETPKGADSRRRRRKP
jgi:hypothetical protein